MEKEIKEKQVVKQIVDHWDTYFPDLHFCKTEYSLHNFRVDILADFEANLKDLNIREEDYFCKPTVFFEVKCNSLMRDLIYEIQKQVKFRNRYINTNKCYCMICTISDEYDEDMVDFLEQNNIIMYKYTIDNNDISTLKISEYTRKDLEIKLGDKNYEQ